MKPIIIILTVTIFAATQVSADLSTADLEKIGAIVKESETRMKEYIVQEISKLDTKITELDKRMKIGFEAVDMKITGVEKRLDTKITEVDKRLSNAIKAVDTQVGRNFNLVLGLIALIVFAVGLPQIITAWQGRILREQTQKYDALKQEVEQLKQERIVRP